MIPYFVTSFIIVTIKLVTQGSMSVDNPVTLFSYVKYSIYRKLDIFCGLYGLYGGCLCLYHC